MRTLAFRYKQNRFQQLRGFCYAAALGSVSKAARRMNLSQPSVSQQILGLESELGAKLFVRHGSRIKLTHDGELLFEMAWPLIEFLTSTEELRRHNRNLKILNLSLNKENKELQSLKSLNLSLTRENKELRQSIEKLKELNLGHFPALGKPVDVREAGPLGELWPHGRPLYRL